jgi:general secretion pathway protein G
VRRGALLTVALVLLACHREPEVDRAAVLRDALASMRGAIAKYRADNGRYPESLQALVPKYLPAIPTDPITNSNTTWRVTTEETVAPNTDFTKGSDAPPARPVVTDVHSGAGAPWSGY